MNRPNDPQRPKRAYKARLVEPEDEADEGDRQEQREPLDPEYVLNLKLARKLLLQGRSPAQIRSALKKRGVSEDEAQDIADDARNPEMLRAARIPTNTGQSSNDGAALLVLGLLLIAVGIGASIFSFKSASSGGQQSYTVFTGLIATGGVLCFKGLAAS
jgi:hypothetical protein